MRPSADVLICLPATLTERAVQTAAGRVGIDVEDCSTEVAGAFTEDLSAETLKGERDVALCDSGVGVGVGVGVGASVAANKVSGARAGLIHDVFSARQGVEDDDINVFCLGGKVIGSALALERITAFLTAGFSNAPRHRRRLAMVRALETDKIGPFSMPIQQHLGNVG